MNYKMKELVKPHKHTAYSLEFNLVLEGQAMYNGGLRWPWVG